MKNKIFLASFVIFIAMVLLYIIKNDYDSKKEPVKPLDKTLTLKMAHNLPKDSALHEASVLFANKVKQRTNNLINIEIYPEQQLGSDYSMVELARNGQIDIILTPTAKMSVTAPSMQYADLPFLFPTREDAYELLDGEVGDLILKDLDKVGLLGVAFWENGFKHFTGNSPLVKPEDFIDKKIRIMKSRIIMEQFKALGAKGIPIDFHATKKALEDNVVDGQENPLVAIVNMRFHEAQSDLTLSGHAYLPYIFSISKKSFNKLSTKVQDILIDTALEVTKWERVETQKREKVFLDTIKQAGVNIHTLTNDQKEQFALKTKYIAKMYEDMIGANIISKTEEYLYNKYSKDDTVAIGVDVSLSGGAKYSGLSIKRGVELAVDEINAHGGLLGKKVVVIAKDHKTISTQGIKNIQEFSKDEKIKAVIGGKQSAIIEAELETIQNSHKPYLIPWASANKLVQNGYKTNYLFRVSANNSLSMKMIFDEVNESKREKSLVIVENSVWGRGALDILNSYTSTNDTKLVSIVSNRGEKDFTQAINMIKQDKEIDSIVVVLHTMEAMNFIQSLNHNNIHLPIVSHFGIMGDQFYKMNKKYLQKTDIKFLYTYSPSIAKHAQVENLLEAYRDKYGKNLEENLWASIGFIQAYDATKLLAIAIKKVNSFDGDKIRDALENIKSYDGVIKKYIYPFSKNNHEALNKDDIFFATYDKYGKIIPISKESEQ